MTKLTTVTFTRETALKEAAAIICKQDAKIMAGEAVPCVTVQATAAVAQVWATIGAAMQEGETFTITFSEDA